VTVPRETTPYDDEPAPALGVVLDEGRGGLPFALVHGEALVACAAWALGEAGVTAVDLGTDWAAVVDAEEPLVLHDSLCPMTPAAFVAQCLARAVELDRVVVAVRPVTDTVKVLHDGFVGETLDRDQLHAVVSPVVLPASVVAGLDGWPTDDLAALVGVLADSHEVELVPAPPEARRVASEDDVRVLEALTAPTRAG
jgi:2-C-methyl-D-erythritol 4-phosphate cytidylyltransferase